MARMKLKGKREMRRKTNAQIRVWMDAAERGIIKAGIMVRGKGMRRTPVDTGNLIGSWYGPVIVQKTSRKVMSQLGLTAFYAPYVHEMVEARFRKPGATAKFLEGPLHESKTGIKRIINRELRESTR